MAKPIGKTALFALPLVALSLACSALGGPSGPPEEGVLFRDDFSDPSSGWDRVQADEGVTDYASGEYRILVQQTQHDYWANPGRSFGDVRVEVDARKGGGPDDNDFGVICRYQDTNNFYAFLISSDGYYAILKYSGGSSETLGTDGMASTDAVNLGDSTNHIRADCVGSTLTLYANGTMIHSTSDSTFSSGDVGLIAGTFDEPGTDVYFDNFVVYQP